MHPDRAGDLGGARWWAVALTSVATAAAVLYRRFGDVGLFGWDAYPLIATSRIHQWTDLLHVTRTSLLGLESGGIYYRPLPKLSLGLDYAFWGLDPRGYHATDVVVFACAALALYWLARSLLGERSCGGALAALAFFLLHPVHATVVPALSRRPDMMCVLFLCLGLAATAHGARRGRWRRGYLAAATLATALALSSKETAFVLPPLAWLTAYLHGEPGGWLRRARGATVVVAPLLVVTAVLVVLRVQILGGLVGSRPIEHGALIDAFFHMGGRVLEGALSGPAIVGSPRPPIALATLLGAGAVFTWVQALRNPSSDGLLAAARATTLACAWIAALVAIYALGMILQPWYLLNVLAALSVLVGAVLAALLETARNDRLQRVPAAAAMAALVWLSGGIAAYSPLLRPYDEWHRATAIEDAHLEALRRRLEAAPAGSVLHTPLPPMLLPPAHGGPQLVGVALIANYAMQAWADLALPQRRIRVSYGRNADATPDPDGVVLVVATAWTGRAERKRDQGM